MGKSLIKKILLLISLSLTSLIASEEFGFIGAGIGYQQVDPGIFETNHTTLGIRVGRQSLDWRTIFGFDYETDFSTIFVEADYIFLDEMFGTPKLRPYLGLNINYIDYNNFFDYTQNITIDEDGYSIGINIGLILYAGDRVDVDIGYHYNSVQSIEPVDYLQTVTLSIHYFY
jgi:hypothetical protein